MIKNKTSLDLCNNLDFYYLQLHITKKCNLRCKHCYIEADPNSKQVILKPNEIFDIIEQYASFLNKRNARGKIYLTGGEPVLDPNLESYIIKAHELGIITMILSNGTLIDETKAFLMRNKGLNIVQISLDGMEQTHDCIRGKNSFEKATRGLDHAHDAGMCTVVMVTLSKMNSDQLEDLVQHCINHHVTRIAFGRLVPTGNGSELSDQLFTKQELHDLFTRIKKLKKKYSKQIIFSFHDPIWRIFTKEKNGFGCSAGIGGICIIENGDIMPCRRMNLVIGNIRDVKLEEIWNDSILSPYRTRETFQGKCKNCKYLLKCGGCRAVALAVNKLENAEDPQCFL